MDWNSAKSACEALGSDLAVLNSKAKLRGFLASAAAAYKVDNVWIGLHSDPTHKASWLWVGGLRDTFATWDSLQPGDHRMVEEDCGVLRISSKKWHDYSCMGARLGYICEINGKYNLHGGLKLENSKTQSKKKKLRINEKNNSSDLLKLNQPL